MSPLVFDTVLLESAFISNLTILRYRSFANRFFREFELFRELHNSYWHSTAERIKVAVLDTGLDKNGTTTRGIIDEIEQNRGKRGRRWHDGPIKQTTSFVGGSGDEDTCGHGTRVAQLILRLAPQADLYVARVSKGYSDEDENAGDNIAKVRVHLGAQWLERLPMIEGSWFPLTSDGKSGNSLGSRAESGYHHHVL